MPEWASGFLLAAIAGQPCIAAQIWLAGGGDPQARWHRPDFLSLFQPDAPWSDVAGSISVFKTTNAFILKAPEDQVRLMIEYLQRRHIALAVEMGLLNGAGSGCGRGIEGFAMPGAAAAVAERVKRLGGSLAYIAMDEPLWFGRYATKEGACHWEIGKIASVVAGEVAQLRMVVPDVRIGDIEPIGDRVPSWNKDIAEWANAYRAATGSPLAFLHADVQWETNWQPALLATAHFARSAGIPFGVIVDGYFKSNTAREWTSTAERRLDALIRDPSLQIDDLVFQSWNRQPERFLPETDPASITGLVRHSLRPELHIKRPGTP